MWVLHFPRTCNWHFSSEADSFPQSAIVFTFMCAPQYFWTLGSFVYLECSNIQITGQENIYILFILQFLKCCSLEPPSRKALYAWPPETQPSFLSKNPDLWMLQSPWINIKKIRLDWSQVYSQLLGNANKGQLLGQRNTVHFQICPQIAYGWLHSSVRFKMRPQISWARNAKSHSFHFWKFSLLCELRCTHACKTASHTVCICLTFLCYVFLRIQIIFVFGHFWKIE